MRDCVLRVVFENVNPKRVHAILCVGVLLVLRGVCVWLVPCFFFAELGLLSSSSLSPSATFDGLVNEGFVHFVFEVVEKKRHLETSGRSLSSRLPKVLSSLAVPIKRNESVSNDNDNDDDEDDDVEDDDEDGDGGEDDYDDNDDAMYAFADADDDDKLGESTSSTSSLGASTSSLSASTVTRRRKRHAHSSSSLSLTQSSPNLLVRLC